MTSLSFGDGLNPSRCNLPGALGKLAREWNNLQSIRLPLCLSNHWYMSTLVQPLRSSLRSISFETPRPPHPGVSLYLDFGSNLEELVVNDSWKPDTYEPEDGPDFSVDYQALSMLSNLKVLSLKGKFELTEAGKPWVPTRT